MKFRKPLARLRCCQVDIAPVGCHAIGQVISPDFVLYLHVVVVMQTPGTLSQILLDCVDLAPARLRCFKLWNNYLTDKPYLFNVVEHYTIGSPIQSQTQFLLDCSVLPDVIEIKQKFGLIVLEQLFHLTRTLCFSVHKMRCKLLGTWITEK